MNVISIAKSGFEQWAAKPHNKKWFRKIDGTPIPNDLVVCIAMAFKDAIRAPNDQWPADTIAQLTAERDALKRRLETAYQVKAEENDRANEERHARLIAEAENTALRAKVEQMEAALATAHRRATDNSYMMTAYRQMLGPKGLEVALLWDDKGVKRIHHSWGPEAASLTGEERAQVLIEFEAAPRRQVESIDGGQP